MSCHQNTCDAPTADESNDMTYEKIMSLYTTHDVVS